MKRKSIFGLLLASIMLGLSFTSCDDMLSTNDERNAYKVAQDSLYSYWGILQSLQNVAERYVILNECRGDLVQGSAYVSDTIKAIANFGMNASAETYQDNACAYMRIRDYYHVINSCNAYIAMCDTSRTTGTNRKYMLREYAQVQSIRAWVYLQLVYAYGRVPFYTKPLITTEDINNFDLSKAENYVGADNLYDSLKDDLEAMAQVEYTLGLPDYYEYGWPHDTNNSHFVCHSSKYMFPVNLVLGDIALLCGKYPEAAQCYYNYLNTENGGPLNGTTCISLANINEKRDNPYYYYRDGFNNSPYNEKSEVSRYSEAITCIPTNKSKLDGKVNTDISRLFGFETKMTAGSGASASAYVGLTPNFERQLLPSAAYDTICDAQNYEIYINTGTGSLSSFDLQILPGAGDARRVWLYRVDGQQWPIEYGENIEYAKMVHKQNPNGSFSNQYPVIYRRSTVWLRFAEALNRAGYPSYAFAILRNGLCNNVTWLPEKPSTVYATYMEHPLSAMANLLKNNVYEYDVTDTLFCLYDSIRNVTVPADWLGNEKVSSSSDLANLLMETYPEGLPEKFSLHAVPAGETAFSDTTSRYTVSTCSYINRRELEKAPSFLNFRVPYFLLNDDRYPMLIQFKQQLRTGNYDVTRLYATGGGPSIGVHQRGCGLIQYYDNRSTYNYVDQINKKLVASGANELTKSEIYSGQYDDKVQDAVEDLIVDEMALELAFEGTRFSDLCRVARRRGAAAYLADRVAKREGTMDAALRAHLLNMDNWYLPLPTE